MSRSRRGSSNTLVLLWVALLSTGLLVSGCAAGAGASEPASDGASETAGDDASAAAEPAPDAADAGVPGEEAVFVEVAPLARGPIESRVRASANLEAERHVQVFAQATGIVERLLVEEGDEVEAGQLLVKLQDDDQRIELALRRAERDKARREFERQRKLYEDRLISEQAFIDARHALERLEIQVEQAQQLLSYTEVRAPIAGTITARSVQLGERVTASQQLFEMVDFDSLVVRLFLPEKNLTRVRVGQEARLTVPALAGRAYRGRVLRVSPTVDARSGTFKVTVAVGGQPGLRPGLYADVDVVVETRADALLVPKRALVYDRDRVFVYRLGDARRVERVFLEPRLENKLYVEPIGDVLDAGDQVVIAGQTGLEDGALVRLPGDPKPGADAEDAGSDVAAAGASEAERASR